MIRYPISLPELEALIDAATNPANPHTNCARSYVALYESNPAEGEEIYNLAFEYWISVS